MTRLLLVAAALVAVLAVAGVGAGAEWDVYPGAGTPIQDAVDGAGAGDTIYVHAGTYVENVDVDKRVTLIGDGADVVTVRARDGGEHVFEVIADHVNISGFTVTEATGDYYAGIHLGNANYCSISNINTSNNKCGFYFSSSNNNKIRNNTAPRNSIGVYLVGNSDYNIISSNDVSKNYRGIYLGFSSNNILITNNVLFNDDYGIRLADSSSNNTLINNTISSNIYGISVTGQDQYSWIPSNNTLIYNNVSNNTMGIWLYSANNNTIHHNNLADNTNNAYDSCTNQWDSGSEGNYWSDYTGTDSGRDGIGDDPYDIPGGGSVDRYPLMAPYSPTGYSVGEGAPDLAIKNHFIDAYNRNGGITVLGNPTTEVHRAWGYLLQDFPGATGYAGGIIMYNPYNNYAYYIHGAIWERYYNLGGPRAKIDIKFELGPPTSDIKPYIHTEPPEVSSHGTQFRYQHFEGGALNHNIDTGEVFEIHGAIFAKWGALGYASDELGLVASDEQEAASSPIGTEGRVSDFEGGHIHWHRTGGHGGKSYETHGAIDAIYCAEGGSGGDLGFPVSDEYVNPSGYLQSDFEGGYITTTDGVTYETFEYADKTPPTLVIGTPEDGAEAGSYIIEVSGVASDESGIYCVMVNGNPVAYGTSIWKTNVKLWAGENKITVTAVDNYFNTETETRTVYYHPDFSFVQITDVHIGCYPGSLYQKKAAEELKESKTRFTNTLNAIGNLTPKPAILLITGDLVEWNHESFLWEFRTILEGYIAQEKMKGHDISVYCIPGNHDRRKLNPLEDDHLVNYHKYITPGPNIKDEDRFGPDNFTFGYGGYLFIGLDSGKDLCKELLTCDSPESTGLTNPQMSWLGDQNDIAPKIIFMHHPAMHDKSNTPKMDSAPGGDDGCIGDNRENFINYCKDHNVQLVLTGHTHEAHVFGANGVELVWTDSADSYPLPYFIQTPSATKDKDEGEDKFKHGYRVIDIKNDKAYPYPYTQTGAHSNLQGSLKCPAHLHAYDSQGRHTGLNASGGVEINIPDSFYIGRYNYSDPNETETILLYNTTEEYRFEIVANLTEEEKASPEIESFNFTVEQQTDDARTTIAHLNVPLTENTTAIIPINLTTTAYTMEIDYDGDGATDETEDPDFIETNYAPTAAIIVPETGSIHNVRAPVEFNGTGRDPEDGILTNFSLVWYSDINGAIGAGERFSTANLSCGAHRITLMVNDSTGLMSTQSIALTIANDWTPGDLNGDNQITPADAAIALRIAATGAHDDAADVSRDGRVTSLDALMILQAGGGRIKL